jgi:hypothetical protein
MLGFETTTLLGMTSKVTSHHGKKCTMNDSKKIRSKGEATPLLPAGQWGRLLELSPTRSESHGSAPGPVGGAAMGASAGAVA